MEYSVKRPITCGHSGLEPESSVFELDSRLRGNDGLRNQVQKFGRTSVEIAVSKLKKFEIK